MAATRADAVDEDETVRAARLGVGFRVVEREMAAARVADVIRPAIGQRAYSRVRAAALHVGNLVAVAQASRGPESDGVIRGVDVRRVGGKAGAAEGADLPADHARGALALRGRVLVRAFLAAALLVALQGFGRLILMRSVRGAAVAAAQRIAHRPDRHCTRRADEAAGAAQRIAVDVLDAERVRLRVAARSHDRAVADLGVDVVLQHADVHRARSADEAAGYRAGKGRDVRLVSRSDVHALCERRAGVAAGLIDARVADPGERVGADHAHVDRPGYADEAAAGGHREVHDLLARPGLNDHAVAGRGVEARRVVAAGERAVVDARRAAARALGVDGRAVGDEGLRVLADDEHAHGSAYADEAGAEAAADDEHLGVVGGRDRDVAARRDGAADRREGV